MGLPRYPRNDIPGLMNQTPTLLQYQSDCHSCCCKDKYLFYVIPAEAGIQYYLHMLSYKSIHCGFSFSIY